MIRTIALALVGSILGFSSATAADAPPNATYFADCLANAANAKSYDRDGRYLHFSCHGNIAKAFFDALGRRAPEDAYEETHDATLYRFTEKPDKDITGLDYCRGPEANGTQTDYICTLIYPAGSFLDK